MRINTNIASLNAQANASQTNMTLQASLEKLSSGLKINKAADDASGMSIADKLRTQASSIGQGIQNANSGSALIQIADKAMSEQSNILDIVKTKLIQASTSTTSSEGRDAIRKDVQKLLEQFDNISEQTNYNGVNLLDKKGADFNFQIGEKSTDVVGLSTEYAVNTKGLGSAGSEGSTQATLKSSSATGLVFEGEATNTKASLTSTAGAITLTAGATGADGTFKMSANDVTAFSATSGDTVVLTTNDAETIAFLNKQAAVSTADGLMKIAEGQYSLSGNMDFANNESFDFKDLTITGLGGSDVIKIETYEKVSLEKTAGTTDITVTGALNFTVDGSSADGISMATATNINLAEGTVAIKADAPATNKYVSLNTTHAYTASQVDELSFTIATEDTVKSISFQNATAGSITLSTTDGNTSKALETAGLTKNSDGTFTVSVTSSGSNDIDFGDGISIANLSFSDVSNTTTASDKIYIETTGAITVENNKSEGSIVEDGQISLSVTTSAGGADVTGFSTAEVGTALGATNLTGLMSLGKDDLTADTANNFMSVIDDAMTQLNSVRSDFGSTQNQLSAATRNMMVTKVNIKAAESVIRDVDYAAESANFNKQNIIAQAGTYAMSQANNIQQNVMKLLQ